MRAYRVYFDTGEYVAVEAPNARDARKRAVAAIQWRKWGVAYRYTWRAIVRVEREGRDY